MTWVCVHKIFTNPLNSLYMVYLHIPIVKVNMSAPFCLQKYILFDSDDMRVCLCPFPFYPVLCTLRCQICDADKNWSAWDKPSHFYLICHCKDFLYCRAQFWMYFLCCCFKCLVDFLQTQWTSLFFYLLVKKKKIHIFTFVKGHPMEKDVV